MKTKNIGIFAAALALIIGSAIPAMAGQNGNGGAKGKNGVRVKQGGNGQDRRGDMKERFEDLFEKIDADGSGEVSMDELKAAREARREEMKDQRDGEGDRGGNRPELSEDEKAEMIAKRKAHVAQVFKKADKDGSGGLNEEEFKRFAYHVRNHRHKGHGPRGKKGNGGSGEGVEPIED